MKSSQKGVKTPLLVLGLATLAGGGLFLALSDATTEPASEAGARLTSAAGTEGSPPSLVAHPAEAEPAQPPALSAERRAAAVVPNVRAGGAPAGPEVIDVEPLAPIARGGLSARARASTSRPPAHEPADEPRLDRGQPDLGDPAEARAVELRERIRDGFRDSREKLRDCYEQILADYPEVADRLVFELSVGLAPDGGEMGLVELVSVSSEALVLDEVACFAAALDEIQLPAPIEDDAYTVRYPVMLTPE